MNAHVSQRLRRAQKIGHEEGTAKACNGGIRLRQNAAGGAVWRGEMAPTCGKMPQFDNAKFSQKY